MSDYTMLQIAFLRGAAQAIDEDSGEKTAGIGSGLLNLGRFALTGGGQIAKGGGRVAKFLSPIMMGGTIGGVANVMGGDPTQPWYERFGKGYLGGMAGGLGAATLARGTVKGLGALGRSGFMQKHAPNFGARLTQAMTGGKGMAGRQTLGDIFRATTVANKGLGTYAANLPNFSARFSRVLPKNWETVQRGLGAYAQKLGKGVSSGAGPMIGTARNWGETAKRVGMWGLTGVPVFGAVIAGDAVASDVASRAMEKGRQPAPYTGAGAVGVAGRGFMNQYMTPQHWG